MSASMFKGLPTSKLLKQIARLNLIAGTPKTAFKLGPQVKKVELILLYKNIYKKGSGLKRFWRYNLPVLKFHNDNVDFVLTRVKAGNKDEVSKVPSKIIIHNTDGTKGELDCALQTHNEILKKLVKATDAVLVPQQEIPTIAVPENRLP